MNIAPQVYSNPDDVRRRLANIDFGLTEETLYAAVLAGRWARRRATELHPPLTGGFNAHADATATVRLRLAPYGWKPCNKDGYPRTVKEEIGAAIAVASGDECTGKPGENPSTKSLKGPCTEAAVLRNAFLLFDHLPTVDQELWRRAAGLLSSDAMGPVRTWILLFHDTDEETRVELSLPQAFNEKRPSEWAERIILRPLPNDDDQQGGFWAPEPGPDFDVPVSLKAG